MCDIFLFYFRKNENEIDKFECPPANKQVGLILNKSLQLNTVVL